jgi:hypothetical protein
MTDTPKKPRKRNTIADGIVDGKRAEEHANREIPGWSGAAKEALLAFLISPECRGPFFMDCVRQWAEDRGLPPAPEPRAWGPISNWAASMQIISKANYAPNPRARMRPTQLWRRGA